MLWKTLRPLLRGTNVPIFLALCTLNLRMPNSGTATMGKMMAKQPNPHRQLMS